MSKGKALELVDVYRSFHQGGSLLEVLKGVNLEIGKGEIVALVGPSGSGKSTLLQISGLLERPTDGLVKVNDKKINGLSDGARTEMRRDEIGFVYQSHHLLPDFTALENLVLPQMIRGVKKRHAEEKALYLLETVGLLDRVIHLPSELSGGEQQRVAIARALVNDPALLLADEPTGNLDPETSLEVFSLLLDTVRSASVGALIATHDMSLARKMDRKLKLKNGQVVV